MDAFEVFLIVAFLVLLVGVALLALFIPQVQSYTLVVDGVEYYTIDFDVENDFIELFDHDHGSFFNCGEKCSRKYINKAEKTFEVIPHRISNFERIINK